MLTFAAWVGKKIGRYLEDQAGETIARKILAKLEARQLYPFSAKCLTAASVIMLAVVLVLLIVIIAELAFFLQ